MVVPPWVTCRYVCPLGTLPCVVAAAEIRFCCWLASRYDDVACCPNIVASV